MPILGGENGRTKTSLCQILSPLYWTSKTCRLANILQLNQPANPFKVGIIVIYVCHFYGVKATWTGLHFKVIMYHWNQTYNKCLHWAVFDGRKYTKSLLITKPMLDFTQNVYNNYFNQVSIDSHQYFSKNMLYNTNDKHS